LNEAFAAQALACQRELGIDDYRVLTLFSALSVSAFSFFRDIPRDGSHRRLARHRLALRRGRTRPGDGLRTGVSLEAGLTVRSFERVI
jgi:hypothetical protein